MLGDRQHKDVIYRDGYRKKKCFVQIQTKGPGSELEQPQHLGVR